MADLTRIAADPHVMMGKPVVRGTRLTVEHILEELAGGLSMEHLLASHPRLQLDDVHAALAFAAASVSSPGRRLSKPVFHSRVVDRGVQEV